jgi:hypothetical protein
MERIWLRIGTTLVGSCEHSDEPSGSFKGKVFSEFLKMDDAPWR